MSNKSMGEESIPNRDSAEKEYAMGKLALILAVLSAVVAGCATGTGGMTQTDEEREVFRSIYVN